MLVIGGTGMLRDATIALARRSKMLTAVSHSRNALRDLGQDLAGARCERRMLSIDWNDPEEFVECLKRHIRVSSGPDLVVAWLHDPALGPTIANALSHPGTSCTFFQVFGSDAADPDRGPDTIGAALRPHGELDYHQIVLGFQKAGEASRWLTHAEIAAGILEAVAARAPVYTVGIVSPWSERPKGIPVERVQT